MSGRLPVFVDPLMYARKGLRMEGVLCISDFERLLERLADSNGEIAVKLTFDMLEGQAVIDGHVTGQLNLLCQRCMEVMTLEFDSDIHLGLVETEQEIDALMPGYEPIMVTGEPMKVAEIIEDEIMLSLPMIPMHAQGECGVAVNTLRDDEHADSDAQTDEKRNPFSVLESLKHH